MQEPEDRTLYVSVWNFESDEEVLEFGDFKIFRVDTPDDKLKWKERLRIKNLPEFVLQREFLKYVMDDDDITGSDGITKEMTELLLAFRLFRPGDIAFPDFIIERPNDGSFNAYSKHFHKSLFK